MPWTRPAIRGAGPVAAPAVAAPKTGCLHSWKEIAGYLNHGVRTVQRWEETEALPVHRHAHEKRDSVYAYPAELDAWWTRHQDTLDEAKKPHEIPSSPVGPGPCGPGWYSALRSCHCLAS